jgi:Arc/MetJ-type ribon-helix-helix transcriptional regulator
MEKNTRIGIRIPAELRERLDQNIKAGKFKDISEIVRKALEEFLKDV